MVCCLMENPLIITILSNMPPDAFFATKNPLSLPR